MDTLKRFYFPILLILVVWISYAITAKSGAQQNSGYLQIEAVPINGTSVKVDGKGVSVGTIRVSVGDHVIKVSKPGFGTKGRTVSTGTGQTVYVGIALQPNTPKTQNWYADHPDDQRLAEGLGSHQADYVNKTANQANPFLSQLPLIYGDGQGGIVNISQGVPLQPGGTPAVYVTAATPAIRQGVLTYMRSRGYDPADMDIVFYGQSNPLDTSGD